MKVSVFLLLTALSATAAEPSARPGQLTSAELKEYAALDGTRRKIVDEALALAASETWLRYRFGSSMPESGGLDCSGAVYFVLRQAGVQPPRSSAAQFLWVKNRGALKEVPAAISSTGDDALDALQPGDLLFWSGTYEPTAGSEVSASHVQIFLGHEKATGAPVMAGASEGRTYRGTKREGYGVFDFKLPNAGSKAKFLGYGLPLTAE